MKTISREEAKQKGLKRYYTGERCIHGHLAERFVSTGGCVPCSNNSKRKYVAKNRDRLNDYKRHLYKEKTKNVSPSTRPRPVAKPPTKPPTKPQIYILPEKVEGIKHDWQNIPTTVNFLVKKYKTSVETVKKIIKGVPKFKIDPNNPPKEVADAIREMLMSGKRLTPFEGVSYADYSKIALVVAPKEFVSNGKLISLSARKFLLLPKSEQDKIKDEFLSGRLTKTEVSQKYNIPAEILQLVLPAGSNGAGRKHSKHNVSFSQILKKPEHPDKYDFMVDLTYDFGIGKTKIETIKAIVIERTPAKMVIVNLTSPHCTKEHIDVFKKWNKVDPMWWHAYKNGVNIEKLKMELLRGRLIEIVGSVCVDIEKEIKVKKYDRINKKWIK